MMIIVALLIGVAVYFLVTGDNPVKQRESSKMNPEEKLKERFVQGDIDEEEYLRMKEVLRK
ncbi:SHOCT domain-containing protein [Gudongella sp. DL1XJH-153]|uniref:SHOCT domain-containing protein n=1 Tax=Gudongella sp. DL1XJH-153 TaxID=3409804 RepID=UPI003BB7E103